MKRQQTCLLFILGSTFLLLFGACSSTSETEDIELDFGYDYYPLEIGRSWVYQVDSVIYRLGVGQVIKDSTTAYLREVVVDTLLSESGETLYITERYHRSPQEQSWRIEEVFTRSRTRDQAFQTESNLPFVKMTFPVVQGKRWDGHAYFEDFRTFPVGGEFLYLFDDWDYVVAETGASLRLNGIDYNDVTTVQQVDYTDASVEYRWAQEKYARNIGLIYREWRLVDSQCQQCCRGNIGPECAAVPWYDRAEKGMYLRQTLIDHY